MASTSQDQRGKRTVAESMKHLSLSDKFSDVKFKFGDAGTLAAHRLILSMRSPVFEAMLYGPLSDESSSEIKIEDTDLTTFSQFLRFIYTDEIDLDGELVLKILYLANKYSVEILEEKCCAYLKTSISVDNVCTIHEHAGIFSNAELKRKCFSFITDYIEEVIESENFLTISRDTLERILAEDSLSASEKVIFDAAVRWAKQQCKKHQVEETGLNIRQQLGESLYGIRFPLIPMDVFAREVCPSRILTTTEENELFRYMAIADRYEEPEEDTVGQFLTKIRQGRQVEVVLGERNDDHEGTSAGVKKRKHGHRGTLHTVRLTIRPEHSVIIHSLQCKDPSVMQYISEVYSITVYSDNESEYSDDEEGSDRGEERGRGEERERNIGFYTRDADIMFDPPVTLHRDADIDIQFTHYMEIEHAEQEQHIFRDGLNLQIKFNPNLHGKIVFSR